MKKYSQYPSNYDKFPAVEVPEPYADDCRTGWESVLGQLREALEKRDKQKTVLVVECYQGVDDTELLEGLRRLAPAALFGSKAAMLSRQHLRDVTQKYVTDDEIFGYITPHTVDAWFDAKHTAEMRSRIDAVARGTVVVYGVGAAWVCPEWDILVYADMARWEIQRRFRAGKASNVGLDNAGERASLQYKRAFFEDWRVCDRFKRTLMDRWDFVLDTTRPQQPKLASGVSVRAALAAAAQRPFRVVPFFDPGPWGGQWMREICGLDADAPNYAWCFDCVPEENSLLLRYRQTTVEIPSIDMVFAQPEHLLGRAVYERFGAEFPIRFDFLDTMQGGNLSLQVHPLTEYIRNTFGMAYTQDESYYMLDTGEGAAVYLGLRNGAEPEAMLQALEEARRTGTFDAEKYVGKYPVHKHQHVLIPAGTIHCSGRNAMVLEISATPFIFTFKLWDWGRLGLDGRPRPINIAHGRNVIQWNRDEEWVRRNILDRAKTLAEGSGWCEERTGLHELEFIETRRHWFTGPVEHDTQGNLNVLNLIEGREAIVESPEGKFAPFTVHYAETFIVPAAVGKYTIRPINTYKDHPCGTIKAYIY